MVVVCRFGDAGVFALAEACVSRLSCPDGSGNKFKGKMFGSGCTRCGEPKTSHSKGAFQSLTELGLGYSGSGCLVGEEGIRALAVAVSNRYVLTELTDLYVPNIHSDHPKLYQACMSRAIDLH